MDDDEKSIVVAALSILAAIAFGTFLLILCDPLLFRYDDDDDDDKHLPRWTITYPEPTQQQQQQQQQPTPPPPPPPTEIQQERRQLDDRPPLETQHNTARTERVKQQETKQLAIPEESEQMEQSSRSETPPTQQTKPIAATTTTSTALVPYDASNANLEMQIYSEPQTALEPITKIVAPMDEFDSESERKTPSMTNEEDKKQQPTLPSGEDAPESSSDGSQMQGEEEKSATHTGGIHQKTTEDHTDTSEVEIFPYTPRESKAFSLPDELKNFHADDGQSDSESEVAPLSPLTLDERVTSMSAPTPTRPTKPPPPPSKPAPTVVPPKRPAPPTFRQSSFHAIKTVIPRYSHKAERQRFIILNALIIFIIACVTTILVIRFYV